MIQYFFIILYSSCQDSGTSPTKHVCSSEEVVTKNDTCPVPANFDLAAEQNKDNKTWKIDFEVI